ncbi:hypothetical protein C8J57DRAFT_1217153 [Mycena rebaudengoi]|nr:hypothetical protein C8J57DRAFT_1217153 [Mycena rebaudengoi]
MDPDNWLNPSPNFAYSMGKPSGQSLTGKEVYSSLLVDTSGKQVPCVRSHSTCQGSKICPYADIGLHTLPHVKASQDDIKERLYHHRETRLRASCPKRDTFLHTVSFISALERYGCHWQASGCSVLSSQELEQKERRGVYRQQTQRGYQKPESAEPICDGRLVFDYDSHEQPYISCEHYSKGNNKAHFHDFNLSNGSFNLDYLEAVFTEEAAQADGYGPLVDCTSLSNFSTQKVFCPKSSAAVSHRNSDTGELEQPLMLHLPCTSKFRVFTPLPEYRRSCPYVLIVTMGDHCHPVPLPSKTPPAIRAELMNLLESLGPDLADLTPCRLMCHPLVKSFLATKFPSLISPTLSDWHISLSNRDHLKSYIKQALEQHFPFGTDWMDEDDETLGPGKAGDKLRIIICMTREASRQLIRGGRYLQSDIGFKRIAWNAIPIPMLIAEYLKKSTTSSLKTRASDSSFDTFMLKVWTIAPPGSKWFCHGPETSIEVRQKVHGVIDFLSILAHLFGSGLGLFLQKLAALLAPCKDFYENRLIQGLGPYDHLHRLFRVCMVHFFRLIKTCAVPENVRTLMRSLVCVEHGDWDGTVRRICELGGKPAQDWVKNKETSQFVFEGICWAKSKIPRDIWGAGDSTSNVGEIVHEDINREGLHLSLLGAYAKGLAFDTFKMNALRIYEGFGITPTYSSRHTSENAYLNLKRRDNQSQRAVALAELKLERFKEKLQNALDKLVRSERVVEGKRRQLALETNVDEQRKLWDALDKKVAATDKLRIAYEKLHAEAL